MARSRLGLCIILIWVTLLGCQCASPSSTPPAVTEGENIQPILTVTGLSGSQELTLAQIKALPATEGWAGIKTSVGTIVQPARYKGVSLVDLSNLVGGLGTDAVVEIVASDGYAMTMSHNEAANGQFVTYDPATGAEIPYADPCPRTLTARCGWSSWVPKTTRSPTGTGR
jgi:hypothetical protein